MNMNQLNTDSEARRESARQADGKFGPQEHTEAAGGTAALPVRRSTVLHALQAESGWSEDDPHSGFGQDDREWEIRLGMGGNLSGGCGPAGSGSCDGETRSGETCSCECHYPEDESEFGAGMAADYHRWHANHWTEREGWWIRDCLHDLE